MTNANREFKSAIYEQFARIGKALSSATRIEILDLLCQGERSVEVLANEVGATIANTSQHLKTLRAARLVDARKDGLRVYYRLANDGVCDLVRALQTFAERQLLEIRQIVQEFLAGRTGMEGVDAGRLIEYVREGSVTVLDVRPVEEYEAGHVEGAISVPLRELERRLADLPKNRPIVAYCRGPYCVLAIEAVEMLRTAGFDAVRSESSVVDWRVRGMPVKTGKEP